MEPIEPVRVAEGEDEPSYHEDLLCLPGCDKEQEHQPDKMCQVITEIPHSGEDTPVREEVIQDTEGEDQFRNKSKLRFLIKMKDITDAKRNNTVNFTKEKYERIVSIIEGAKGKEKKSREEYQYCRRYAVAMINGCPKLVVPDNGVAPENLKYYVHECDIFEILYDNHLNCGHGGRDKMVAKLNANYKNITREIINIFLKCCEICLMKAKTLRKGLVVKPILSKEFNSRAQVDLIDLQSNPDDGYKHIMVYQDHLTKFCSLRPLKTKTAEEVVMKVSSLFATFGAPSILHSDNGREFANKLLTDLCARWPGTIIVHGKPRHSQSQGSVERANQCIEKIMAGCMKTEPKTGWTKLLDRVQYMKNTSYHSGIKMTPYEAMFGTPPKMGITGFFKRSVGEYYNGRRVSGHSR